MFDDTGGYISCDIRDMVKLQVTWFFEMVYGCLWSSHGQWECHNYSNREDGLQTTPYVVIRAGSTKLERHVQVELLWLRVPHG